MLIFRILNAILTLKHIFENWQRKEQCRKILLFFQNATLMKNKLINHERIFNECDLHL